MKYLHPYIIAFKVFLFFIICFTFYRVCFIFFNIQGIPDQSNQLTFLFVRSFLNGLNFDVVVSSYLITPFVVFLFIRQLTFKNYTIGMLLSKWYLMLLFAVCFLICAADIPYFKQFANHLNRDALSWTSTPDFMLKLIFSSISYGGFLFFFLILVLFMFRCFAVFFSNVSIPNKSLIKWKSIVVFLLLGFVTFIGIRGRTTLKSPINIGTAFFSEHAFFNQLGLNPCFVFFSSIKQEKQWPFLKNLMNEKEFKAAIQQISNQAIFNESFGRTYSFDTLPRKYNVMLVLMESMSMTKLGYHHSAHLTSSFDTIVRNGLFFNQFYSSGINTFNGLFSTETGFPSIMNTHPLKTYTDKAFKGISFWLKQNGYKNYFFTTHDGQFDNMQGFMKFNNFDYCYTQEDYPSNKSISTLGVPDHYEFEFALKKMDEQLHENNAPFFSYILTSSDHGPWAIPKEIPFTPNSNNEQDRATQYADWALGHFIKKAKTYPWFNNTLFVFVADHGVNFGHTYAMPLSYNHIPCVFYMPSQIKPDTISNLGGQIDVMPTLLSFLKMPIKNTSMGIDLLHEKRPWMYFSADSKIGAIDNNYYYFNLLDEQKELLYEYKDLDTKDYFQIYKTKADSMKDYSIKMIRAANYIIKNKLY